MRKVIIFLLFAVLLTACSSDGPQYKIGVSQCAEGQWRDNVNQEMLAAQHLYEQSVRIDIAHAHDNTERQIRQIDSLVATGIDLLVVAPNEAEPIGEALGRVMQRGIPVICFDRKVTNDNYTAFIGCDNVEAGHIMGDYALRLLKSTQTKHSRPVILELTGSMSTSPAQNRHEGFAKAMESSASAIDYSWFKGEWSSDSAYQITKRQIEAGRQPDIVFCHIDGMAMGVYNAFKDAGLEDQCQILGIDGMPDEGIRYVQDGIMQATYVYPSHGEKIVRLALDILTGKPYQRENYVPSTLVTPDDADIVAMNTKELMSQRSQLITIREKLEYAFSLYDTQRKVLAVSLMSIVLLVVGVLLMWKAIKQIRKAHRRMKQMNEEQTLFYTNARHQLKTPLTLIAGPVKELMDSTDVQSDKQKQLLEIISRNVAQLETVTSSVLNFRREMAQMVSDATADSALQQVSAQEVLQDSRVSMMKQEDSEELSTVLIIDDNDDMRRYLRTLLADRFYVLEAADGQSGLKLARESVPDLVVSDVMMPVMDGLQLCKKLKEDAITSHVPVILLTARSEESQQIEGFEHGADAYLTKPFSADMLIARIYNLLKIRRQLRVLFDGKEEEPVKLSTQDKLFIDTVKEAIQRNMSNQDLRMDDLGEEIGLSRVQMYRKVKALTGLSPVELLREMRLQRGYALLSGTTKTVAEVAYEVGFSKPGYFSSCFKTKYGKLPTEIRAE